MFGRERSSGEIGRQNEPEAKKAKKEKWEHLKLLGFEGLFGVAATAHTGRIVVELLTHAPKEKIIFEGGAALFWGACTIVFERERQRKKRDQKVQENLSTGSEWLMKQEKPE